MPIIDLYGEAVVDGELVLDITSDKFTRVVLDLLPNGHAWDREDPVLQELVRAEAVELSRVDVRARAFKREMDPTQTFELMTDWEVSYGLPECAEPETLEGRRAALQAKLLSEPGHDQSLAWWTSFIDKLGYDLNFVDLGPGIMTCVDESIDVVNEEAFLWALATNHGPDDELLECFVSKNAPLISFPIVHYLWQQQLVPGFETLCGVAGNAKGRVACVGLGGVAFYGSPDLATWTAATGIPVGQDIRAICDVDGTFVAVGASGLDAIYSDDGGQTWASSAVFAGSTLNGVSRGPLLDQVAVAVGLGGAIWRTANAGQTWASVASPTALQLLNACSCAGAMVAAGVNGTLIRTTANGAAPWSIIAVPGLINNINGVSGVGSVVVLVTSGGQIWRSADAGLIWVQMTSPTFQDLYCVTGSVSGRWTAGGRGGQILQSLDDGITWEVQVSQAATTDLLGCGYHRPDGAVVLVGPLSTLITE